MANQTAPPPQNKSQPARRGAAPVSPKSGSRGPSGEAARRLGSNSLVDFYRESVAELKKVTWPTWQDATNLTVAVIGMTIAVAVFLGVIDEVLNLLIKPIIGQ